MGRMLLEAIAASEYNVELSAAILRPDSALCGVDTGTLLGGTPSGVLFTEDIKVAVNEVDVLVDFTPPAAAVLNAQYCAAMGTPYITLHDQDIIHPLKEVDAAAQAWETTPEQVVELLNYIVNQE